MKAKRIISWYDKKTDKLIDEIEISEISLDTLRKLFRPSDDDYLMYNPYEIGKEEMIKLEARVNLSFEPERYYYYLECFQEGK